MEEGLKPFCSKRCADVDLGRWLKGGYAIPGPPADPASPSKPSEKDPAHFLKDDLQIVRPTPKDDAGPELVLAAAESRQDATCVHGIVICPAPLCRGVARA